MIRPGGTVRELLNQIPGQNATVHGWVKTRRDSKGIHFLQVSDGSCFSDLQVVVEEGIVPEEQMRSITTGSSVRVEGELVESPAAGQKMEMKAHSIYLYGAADPVTYPLQKKGHTMEFLREIAHLRPRSNTFGSVFRVRNALAHAIHTFFQNEGFLYVHTPILTASDCEGAGAMFGVTTLDLMNLPREKQSGKIDYSSDFFAKPAFLTVSGQLEAEIFAMAFTNVYTFGPTFRAENSNTPRHLAEFWMIEPEIAFADLKDDMELAERFLKFVINEVMNRCEDDIAFFDKRIDNTVLSTLNNVVKSDFEHITYTEAVAILEKSDRAWEFPVKWGSDLQSEHERYLTEEVFKKPVIVTDYPKEIKAFYMRANDDGKTVRAMDVLAPRIGEIIGGSQREERLDVLQSRLADQGLEESAYWWYLDLRRFGTVPHAGFGLGFERLMLYLTGMKNIRDVIPFPRTPGSADF